MSNQAPTVSWASVSGWLWFALRSALAHAVIAATALGIWILWVVVLATTIPLLPIGIGLALLPVLLWVSQTGALTTSMLLRLAGLPAAQPQPLPAFALEWQTIRTIAGSLNVWRVLLFTGILLFPMGIVSTVLSALVVASATVLIAMPFISENSLEHILVGGPTTVAGKVTALIGIVLISVILGAIIMRLYAIAYHLVVATGVDEDAARRRVADLERSRRSTIGEEARQLRALERNLHDGPQQILVRTGMDLSLAQRRIAEGEVEQAQAAITQAQAHTREALEQMRTLVRGFAPPVLAERGLSDALAVLAANAPIPTLLHSILPSNWRIEPTVEQTLYFIASECLANAGKYSGASQVNLVLDEIGGQLRLTVRDNGLGGAQVLPGHGLEGIGGRASSIDATWQLDSGAGGTTVTVICSPTLWWR